MSDIAVPVSETAPTHADEREPSALHANLVKRIRELVIEGDLERAKVPERILCERFNVPHAAP